MNRFSGAIVILSFLSLADCMSSENQREIKKMYKSNRIALLELYRKGINTCQNHEQMSVVLTRSQFDNIETRIIQSTENLTLLLTLDDYSTFSIPVMFKCNVKKNNRTVFVFFAILLPLMVQQSSDYSFPYYPLYQLEKNDRMELFADGHVFCYRRILKTYTVYYQNVVQFLQVMENPKQMDKLIETELKPKYTTSEYTFRSAKWYHGDFVVILDDQQHKVNIPAILVSKIQSPSGQLEYRYNLLIIGQKNEDEKHPFFQTPQYARIGSIQVHDAKMKINNKWAFAKDSYLVNHSSQELPPFITDLSL